WHASVQGESEPGCGLSSQQCGAPDAGTSAGHFPLGEQHSLLPRPGGEQPAQDRRRYVERNVSNDYRGGERVSEDVGLFDRHTGYALAQLSDPVLVDVDRGKRPLKACQVPSKCATAGTDF